jgi:redox-sensitive bicupin YhaK (pirin superfamily)
MSNIIVRANERGSADHGWLNAKHTFSFAGYYNPERVHFGMLRVFNDDIVAPGMGFGMHPHDNMEIVTIPIHGELEHKDSEGHSGVITEGEVQVMSAGSGLYHSEFNHSKENEVNLMQIWVFPRERDIKPRYDQKKFDAEGRTNKFQVVASPEKDNGSLWLNQNVYFNLGNFDAGQNVKYERKLKNNGLWLFMIEGEAEVNGEKLNRRDSMGITDTDAADIKFSKDSKVLIIDVPMN